MKQFEMSRTFTRILPSCFLLIFLLVACSSGTPVPPMSLHVSPTPVLKLGAPGCSPPSPLDTSNIGLLEARGTTPALDLWSLFLGEIPQAKETIKIIWRVGESFEEPVQIVGIGPSGQRLQPLFLDKHVSSNWYHPGAEWGTGFEFPIAGCWDLHVTGGSTAGDVWVIIPS